MLMTVACRLGWYKSDSCRLRSILTGLFVAVDNRAAWACETRSSLPPKPPPIKVPRTRTSFSANPLVNLYLQGRGDSQPIRRGITRVKELLEADVNVTCGLDDVCNIFFPFGRMDMLEVAMITSITAHLTTPDQIQTAFDMPRQKAAQTLGLVNYELTAGAPANVVFIAADNAQEALRLQPMRRFVVRHGRIVVSNEVSRSLYLE